MAKREHRPTQCDRIIQYIKDFGSITTWEAMMDLGVARLASRIFDLKEKGYEFEKTRVNTKNRYGEKTHYDEYRLKETPKNALDDKTFSDCNAIGTDNVAGF